MCDTVFAIGQRGAYYFAAPSKVLKGRLPAKLQSLFTENKVASVHCMVLGAGQSFFIAYKTKAEGQNRCRSDGLPESLHSFLFEKGDDGYLVRELDKIQVSLGPYNKSWWATDGTRWKWSGLPTGLIKALKERRKPEGGWTSTPRLVALGAADNYVMITDNHGGAWDLSAYPHLRSLIRWLSDEKSGGFKMIHNLYLNPYRLNGSILQSKNGTTLASSLPPHAENTFITIQHTIKEDTLAMVKREIKEMEAVQAQIARVKLKQAQAELANQRLMAEMMTASTINHKAMQTAFNINLLNIMNS